MLYPSGVPARSHVTASVLENSSSEVVVELRTGADQACRYSLGIGQPFVGIESSSSADWLAIEAPCRFVAIPDFFADDIVVNAADIPVDAAELPSENFLLHFLAGGDAARHERRRLAGPGRARHAQRPGCRPAYSQERSEFRQAASHLGRGPGGARIWHEQAVQAQDADKVLDLQWTNPFAAQWRVDWRRSDGLTSSWEMIAEKENGDFEKYGWFGSPNSIPADRRRWTTVIGSFAYPCWIDHGGQGHLQPLKKGGFSGPALIYPINRVGSTPLAAYTVVDVVRATLGVGPCEYILDVEGQGTSMQGRATCSTRDALKAIYSASQQKEKRREIETILDEVNVFVTHIHAQDRRVPELWPTDERLPCTTKANAPRTEQLPHGDGNADAPHRGGLSTAQREDSDSAIRQKPHR